MKVPECIDLIIEGIISGKYSLFLGAGVSKDSLDRTGNRLKDGEEFRKQLCRVTDMPETTPLSSVAQLLTDEDRKRYITEPFSYTKPGVSYTHFSDFIWKDVYTLNVDDCIEQHYTLTEQCKQTIISKNYKDSYEKNTSLNNVQVVHLHGYTRKPTQGYVFDLNEYVNNIRDQNTWYKIFANEFSTNSFIVSGISFNEPDFIYYVNQRNENTVRDDFYPSLLIEPFPNRLTRQQCERHNLQLVEGTFGDFLEMLYTKIKHIPTVYELLVSKNDAFSQSQIEKHNLELFFNQFIQIKHSDNTKEYAPDAFFRGFEPTISDIVGGHDINRDVTKVLYEKIQKSFTKMKAFVLVNGKTYSGKTAAVLRVLFQAVKTGHIAFQLKSVSGFDVDNTVLCLNSLKKQAIVFIDNLSDYIDLANRLFSDAKNILVIGAERGYREMHIQKVLNCHYDTCNCDKQTEFEIRDLINRYRNHGILASSDATHKETEFILDQKRQTIGETVCTLVNDFTPMQSKIQSLLDEYNDDEKTILATTVLAYHCYRVGLHYEVFQGILPRTYSLAKFLKKDLPIKLSFQEGMNQERDYIVPENKVLAKCTFEYFLKFEKSLLQSVYKKLLSELSYYVTRRTIKARSAEARLVARLFDIDDIMKLLFGDNIEQTLIDLQSKWVWNSRYWEQRALAVINTNTAKALLHAQQAVALERHPNTLTTLSKVQFKLMESDFESMSVKFEEATKSALQAMNLETQRNYHAIQPLIVLKNGLNKYLELGDINSVDAQLRYEIKGALSFYLDNRHFTHGEEAELNDLIRNL